MKQIEFFQRQMEILNKLFSPEWFLEKRQKDHPAYLRWALCRKIVEQEGIIQYPEQKEELHKIGRIVLDSYILVALTEGVPQQLKLGSIDLYGDKAVQKKIRSRITNPQQFEDLMVELYVGAWHKTKNHAVNPLEIEGYPDLKIDIPNVNIPVFIECKHLWTTSKNRLQKIIKKANKQINMTKTPSYGVVTLDVSTPVGVRQVQDDSLPVKLQEIIDIVQSSLSGPKNRFIGAAVVVWDDYMIIGKPPDRTLIAFRRRSKHIWRKGYAPVMPRTVPLFEGYTTTYRLHWVPREHPTKNYVFSDLFQKECKNKFHISRIDVIETIQKCDKEESVIFNRQKEFVFFSRRSSSVEREFYMLVCAERRAQSLIVYWAFKVPADLCQEVRFLSPVQLLARFANTYGLPVTIGALTSNFIFVHRIEVSSSEPTRFIAVHNPENHSFMNCFLLKVSQKERTLFIADCALAFCIDTTRYVNWIDRQN